LANGELLYITTVISGRYWTI